MFVRVVEDVGLQLKRDFTPQIEQAIRLGRSALVKRALRSIAPITEENAFVITEWYRMYPSSKFFLASSSALG